uniref:Uncharacterized protein n=1 Tax=Arundo donax TaxID=35708 RepID=A0A0A9H0S6_ARUDO
MKKRISKQNIPNVIVSAVQANIFHTYMTDQSVIPTTLTCEFHLPS